MGMSAGSLLAETSCRVSGTFVPPGQLGSLANVPVRQSSSVQSNFEFGTTTAQVDTIIFQDVSLAAGASATYDIYTGTDLKDLNGNSAPYRVLRYFSVSISEGGDSSGVRVGGAASNEFQAWFGNAGDQSDVFPTGPAFQQGDATGKSVGSSNKNIKIANLGRVETTARIILGGSIQSSGSPMGLGLLFTYP